jgi:hypothetical protein
MSLLWKNLRRRIQGKDPIVNTTGQTREEMGDEENEEDTAPKAVKLDVKPKSPTKKKKISLKASAFLGPRSPGTNSTGPGSGVSGQQGQPHRSQSNPGGPVQSRTSYDKDAMKRLASELLSEGREITPETLRQLQGRQHEVSQAIMLDIGHEAIARSDMVFVSIKGSGGLSGPPMVLKNRIGPHTGFEIGAAGNLMKQIAESQDKIEIEVIRDPQRTIYLLDFTGDRDKAYADMKAEQAQQEVLDKYILIKGIPRCHAFPRRAAGYPKPVVSVIRGHAHNAPVASGEILAQVWTDEEDVILSIKIRKGDLPLPLTVQVDADAEGVMGEKLLTFLRQGTFPDDDKISRVVVDLNQKGSAGKQPAIDEEFVDQVNKAMDDWDGMVETELSDHSHSISISAAGAPVFSSSMMVASAVSAAVSSFQSATAIPNTRSKIADQGIHPGAMMSSSVIKTYASERALEISEAVAVEALAESKQKIKDLEKKVKKLETRTTRVSNERHKAKSSYASRARGGTSGV